MLKPISASKPHAVTRSTPGIMHQAVDIVLARLHPASNLLLYLVDPVFGGSQVIHQLLQQKPVMFGHAGFQGQPKLRPALQQPMLQQVGNPFTVLLVGLAPGTALMCWAFTSRSSNWPSRMFHTGFQQTPVDSIAGCVTPDSRSQSAIANRSRVKVRNRRFSCFFLPFGKAHNTQTVMLFLRTSRPAQRSYTTSTDSSPPPRCDGCRQKKRDSPTRALRKFWRQPFVVPQQHAGHTRTRA
jgi:hypothetical protein